MRRALHAAAWLGLVPIVALADGDLPPLQPPHGNLSPTFWEQHRWTIVAAAVVALALLVLLIVWLRRCPGRRSSFRRMKLRAAPWKPCAASRKMAYCS